jgi:Rrf2 family protein
LTVHIDHDFFLALPALIKMLTAKGKYSLKALAHLATLKPGDVISGVEIAEANNIPKRFLGAILGELRAAGLIATRKGPGGGYKLARGPNEIRLGHIIRTIDGPLAPLPCASRTAYQPCQDCKSVKRCTVRLMMRRVRDAMSEILDRVTIADMVAMNDGSNIMPIRLPGSARPRAGRSKRVTPRRQRVAR